MVAAAYTPLLDDAEKLSVADLRALQFDRLRWSIGHAFDKCAPYRALCESAVARREYGSSSSAIVRARAKSNQRLYGRGSGWTTGRLPSASDAARALVPCL